MHFAKLSFLFLTTALMCSSCGKPEFSVTFKCLKDEIYGAIQFDTSISEFNKLGFTYGDSLDLYFSNGKSMQDIPYYSGFYLKRGEYLVCGQSIFPRPRFTRNNYVTCYDDFDIKPDTTVTVKIHQKAGYLKIEQLFDLDMGYDIKEYNDDKYLFSNFFAVKGGSLKNNLFYRCSSPCDNSIKRAKYVSECLKEKDVNYVINLSDSAMTYLKHKSDPEYNSPYYDELYQKSRITFLKLSVNYYDHVYADPLAKALLDLSNFDFGLEEPHIAFHCVEGKDRTGFLSFLILLLSNANDEEMNKDYISSFEHLFNIASDTEKGKEQEKAILDIKLGEYRDFFIAQSGEANSEYVGAEEYLRFAHLTDDQIQKIKIFLWGLKS